MVWMMNQGPTGRGVKYWARMRWPMHFDRPIMANGSAALGPFASTFSPFDRPVMATGRKTPPQKIIIIIIIIIKWLGCLLTVLHPHPTTTKKGHMRFCVISNTW